MSNKDIEEYIPKKIEHRILQGRIEKTLASEIDVMRKNLKLSWSEIITIAFRMTLDHLKAIPTYRKRK